MHTVPRGTALVIALVTLASGQAGPTVSYAPPSTPVRAAAEFGPCLGVVINWRKPENTDWPRNSIVREVSRYVQLAGATVFITVDKYDGQGVDVSHSTRRSHT